MKKWMIAALLIAPTLSSANVVVSGSTTVEKVQAAIGPTTAVAQTQQENVTVISPRTGISYTFANPEQRQVIFQTAAIAPANAVSAQRIVATNPALSVQSQDKAKQTLLASAQP